MDNQFNNKDNFQFPPTMGEAPKKEGVGAIIGSIIVIVILILGGLYFWTSKSVKPANLSEAESLQELNTQSGSDDLNSIQNDLDNTKFSDPGKEIGALGSVAE